MMRVGFILLVLLGGCIRVNVGSTGGHVVYLLDPPPVTAAGAAGTGVVEVADFTAAPSYDTPGMVMVTAAGKVVTATQNRWSARPAAVCTETLWRDLVASGAVRAVHRRPAPGRESIVVEGHVGECGARETADGWRAVLDVTVSLSRSDGTVLLQRHRRLESPMREGFASLAEEIPLLMRTWADSVIADICRYARPGESPAFGETPH